MACGGGRNGLYLLKQRLQQGEQQGLPVVFADRNQDSLNTLNHQLKAPSRTWSVDFEVPDSEPLSGQSFSAIMVFRYLHRPLFDAIKQAIAPGGMIIYETFTVAQAALGRPKNPDFLLHPGELAQLFDGWQVLHQFEGISNGSAIAQLVAIKPSL